MKKIKIIIGIFILAIISICWGSFHVYDVSSPCDSPVVGDHSGAPGETNCSGCHAGSVNTGSGTLQFTVGNNSTYMPGQTYTCNVTITQAGLTKFGFVNVALRTPANTTIGTFTVIDAARTRKYALGGRGYFSHTPCGADANPAGQSAWNYLWTAPANNVGTITLYISALASNHNHATSGDFTYTKTIVLTPSAAAIEEIPGMAKSLTVFPNPTADLLSLSYENLSSDKTEIKIINLQGRTIALLFSGTENKGTANRTFSLKERKISSGIYWLRITVGNKSANRKVAVI